MPPIKFGERANGIPSHETDSILAAMIAGKSPDQIRELVCEFVAARTEDLERVSR